MKGTEKITKMIWKAKINGSRYGYEEVIVNYNEWLNIPPYATLQDVLIQDIKGSVTLGWVESQIYEDLNDGSYKVRGIRGGMGGNTLKFYMLIPFPFEDFTYWNWVCDDDFTEKRLKKEKPYIIAVERKSGNHTTYKLSIGYYNPNGKYSDWVGYDYKDCDRTVIAWREIPPPKEEMKPKK